MIANQPDRHQPPDNGGHPDTGEGLGKGIMILSGNPPRHLEHLDSQRTGLQILFFKGLAIASNHEGLSTSSLEGR
jgi:hypothetical protein